MLKTGLVSVTHRNLSIEQVTAAAKEAGLGGVEWGGDVHVPHGDLEKAKLARRLCEENSLEIYSYGSYYRCTAQESANFGAILDTALALETKNIRVWAGCKPSAELDVEGRASLVAEIRRICALCAPHDITVSFEWHSGTATDTPESAVSLISEIAMPNARLYWQPNQFKTFEFNLRSLEDALPYVSNVHVFAWEGRDMLPLDTQWKQWSEYIRVLRRASGTHALLMEFVPHGEVAELIRDAATLRSILNASIPEQVSRLGLDIPFYSDRQKAAEILSRPVKIGKSGAELKNSITVHPMEGFDSAPDGSPGELTRRRYMRFAKSGASLIWFEAMAVQRDAITSPHQLMLTADTLDAFKRMNAELHATSPGIKLIAQLTHSGRFSKPDGVPAPKIAYHNPILNEKFNISPDYPVVDDDYLDRLGETMISAASLAYEAGFDGVDIKCCHRYLMSELLSAYNRPGKYGGCYENRTRLFRDVVSGVCARLGSKPGFIIGSRFALSDNIPYPWGFGCDENGNVRLEETIALLGEVSKMGLSLVDITMGTPYYNPHVNRPYSRGGYLPPENPLCGVERLLSNTAAVKRALPNLVFIGTGYTYLGSYAPLCAAAMIERGEVDAAGFGRLAFAYDTFAADMLAGRYDERKSCITCGKCTEIMRAGASTGCPVRDCDIYAPIYRKYCMKK